MYGNPLSVLFPQRDHDLSRDCREVLVDKQGRISQLVEKYKLEKQDAAKQAIHHLYLATYSRLPT